MILNNVQIGYTKPLISIRHLELNTGKLYVLIGANGKGKSTLLNSISGNLDVLSGKIEIEGKAFSNYNSLEKSKTVGFVQSRFAGIPFMTGLEYLKLGRTPYTNAFGRLSPSDEMVIEKFIKQLHIEHLADKFTLEISDGERQLLAIARVLIQETPYILLDEPTAFLDYSNKKSLLNLLMKIARDENKCILFSSHDLELTLGFSPDSICIPSNSIDIQHLTGKSYSIEDVIELCFT